MRRLLLALITVSLLVPQVGFAALTDNLVSYWKLDESSGNADDAHSTNDLTNENTVGYTSAVINNGADFGAANTNKRLIITSDLGLAGTAAKSFSIWWEPSALPTSGNQVRFLDHRDGGTGLMMYIRLFNDGGTQKIGWNYERNGVGGNEITETVTLSTGTAYHFAMTFDGTNLTAYRNATEIGTTAVTGGTGSGISDGFSLAATANGFLYSSGIADEVGVWSREITSTEVTDLYNAGAGFAYPFAPDAAPEDIIWFFF